LDSKAVACFNWAAFTFSAVKEDQTASRTAFELYSGGIGPVRLRALGLFAGRNLALPVVSRVDAQGAWLYMRIRGKKTVSLGVRKDPEIC
jgi:hypothetical protein